MCHAPIRYALAMALAFCASAARASDAPTAGDSVVVLDTASPWRMHITGAMPVIAMNEGLKEITLGKRPWLALGTAAPDAGWQQVDFDDSRWLRGPARLPYQSPFISRLCMRGAFTVTDPSAAGGLRLSVGYRGGLIAYLNGKEIARAHLPEPRPDGKMLAESYPAEAFTPEGGWKDASLKHKPVPETPEQDRLRTRRLAVDLPTNGLRRGLNVLALEIVRAPYHAIVEEKKGSNGPSRYCGYNLAFNTCELCDAQLTTSAEQGLIPNAARRPGLHAWNSDPLAMDFDLDFGGQAAPLRPLRLVGARNGIYSGKVVVGSTSPIHGLRGEVAGLMMNGSAIPASAIRVRYAAPGGDFRGSYAGLSETREGVPGAYPRRPAMLGVLLDEPLEEFPVLGVADTVDSASSDTAGVVPGAVVPLWLTVDVPKDAAAGTYMGELVIRAEGGEPVKVPVHLDVADFTLPDKDDYRAWIELNQSPDTLAMEYGLEPWSDRHFRLIARSMRFLKEAGSRILYIPLICQTNLGNEESMVRWIRKGSEEYSFDFAVMDRYIDVALANMGRPKVVCFIAWEAYLCKRDFRDGDYRSMQARLDARKQLEDGPMVSLLDPATGKTETVHVPTWPEEAGRKLWKRLFDALRRRMRRRGLEEQMMLGWFTDDWPPKEENKFYEDVTGGLPWVFHSHYPITDGGWGPRAARRQVAGQRKIGYESHIVGTRRPLDCPETGSMYGWKRPDLYAQLDRWAGDQPGVRWRNMVEFNITGTQRGVSRLGADTWPVIDRRGRRALSVVGRYPHSSWRNLGMPGPLLARGPDGALATYHFEVLREGIQDCEARIVIEKALTDDALRARLGDDLARRCQEYLVERTRMMLWGCLGLQLSTNRGYVTGGMTERNPGTAGHYWFLCSGWQERTRQLYTLAGEVARKLGEQ